MIRGTTIAASRRRSQTQCRARKKLKALRNHLPFFLVPDVTLAILVSSSVVPLVSLVELEKLVA